MPEHATHWTRITGDGLIYDGPCIVQNIIFWPDVAADYVDVYDGRDTTTGTKFARIELEADQTRAINLGSGVLFSRGIYIDGIDLTVQTTITYTPTN